MSLEDPRGATRPNCPGTRKHEDPTAVSLKGWIPPSVAKVEWNRAPFFSVKNATRGKYRKYSRKTPAFGYRPRSIQWIPNQVVQRVAVCMVLNCQGCDAGSHQAPPKIQADNIRVRSMLQGMCTHAVAHSTHRLTGAVTSVGRAEVIVYLSVWLALRTENRTRQGRDVYSLAYMQTYIP
jgi:ribosomal protein L44E